MDNNNDINNTLQEVVNEIKNGKFTKGYKVIGAVLTGSFVHGIVHKYSDIDIFVVVLDEMDNLRHIVFKKNGILVQIRVCSIDKFEKDCLIHDRKRPAFYACKVLFEVNAKCSTAIHNSKKYMELGPFKMSEAEKKKLVCTLKNELCTVNGLIDSNKCVAAVLLINELVHMFIEWYNDTFSYWMSNNNYLFGELQIHDEKVYKEVEQIILNNDAEDKLSRFERLCNTVIDGFDKITGEYIYDEII